MTPKEMLARWTEWSFSEKSKLVQYFMENIASEASKHAISQASEECKKLASSGKTQSADEMANFVIKTIVEWECSEEADMQRLGEGKQPLRNTNDIIDVKF